MNEINENSVNVLSKSKKIEAVIFYKNVWKLNRLFKYLAEIKKICPDIVHLQYPTEGYGYSFLPLILVSLLPNYKVITLHEFSSRTFKARLFTVMLLFFINEIIVSNNEEFDFINKNLFLKGKKKSIINIGSNILPSKDRNRELGLRYYDIIYFGHIRPFKGIEKFLLEYSMLKSKFPWIRGAIIGQVLPNYENYFRSLKLEQTGLELVLNVSSVKTADFLANSKIAYLPFVDGVSSKRGSLLAVAVNGCQVITTFSKSEIVNKKFEPYVHLVHCNEDISQVFMDVLKVKENKRVLLLGNFFDWNEIALKHIELYLGVCGGYGD
jgi:glycosyltransferase involved in cell wall biosynthesis